MNFVFVYCIVLRNFLLVATGSYSLGASCVACLVDSAAGVVGSVDPAADVGAVRLQFLVSAVTCWLAFPIRLGLTTHSLD